MTPRDEPLSKEGQQILDWANPEAKTRGKSLSFGPARIKRYRQEVDRMRAARDWGKATPVHLVALYMYCHAAVYGVEAGEIAGKTFGFASALAAKLVREKFEGSVANAVQFVRWTWIRERGREKWRCDNGRSGGRLGWRLQFSLTSGLWEDWQIDLRRRRRAGSSRK